VIETQPNLQGGSIVRILKYFSMLTIMLVFAHTLWGQAGTTGTILGTVTDSTGAVIAGAPVEITNTATGVVTKVT
jgi:hypothetical protein